MCLMPGSEREYGLHAPSVLGDGALSSNRSFDTDAQRQSFASLRSSPQVAGQLQRWAS